MMRALWKEVGNKGKPQMVGYDKYTDEELILRLRAGESGIIDYLVGKYKDLVRQKARAMFLIGGDTDDLIQEGMIGLFKAIRDYQPGRDASLRTFAGLCIDRQLYSAIQNSNRQKHQPLNSYVSLSYEKHVTESPQNQSTAKCAIEYIKNKRPTFVNIVFDEPDHVGHADGHDTPAYYKKLNELDGYIGQIMQAIKEAGIWDETIIIVTADHGGIEKGHGGKTMQEMETAFIIAGKNVKKGYEFSESMMQFDCAATIAYIFGLEQPQVWIGRPMKQVFE